MTEPHYTIKPLELIDKGDETWLALQPLWPSRYFWFDRDPLHGMWRWGLHTQEDIKVASGFGFPTLEAAKAAADAHNRQLLEPGLRRVA